MSQIGIIVFGATAIFLVGLKDNNPWRRWGFVFGICSQPFWFYTTWQAEQYGIFALSIFYAGSWINGFNNHWNWKWWRL